MEDLSLTAIEVTKNQKLIATELAQMKKENNSFQKTLQPKMLKLFGTEIKIAKTTARYPANRDAHKEDFKQAPEQSRRRLTLAE